MFNIFNNSVFRYIFSSPKRVTIGSCYIHIDDSTNPFNNNQIYYMIDDIKDSWCKVTLHSNRCGIIYTSSFKVRDIYAFFIKVDVPACIIPIVPSKNVILG